MLNKNLEAPTIRTNSAGAYVQPTLPFNTAGDRILRGVDIFEDGTLTFDDADGNIGIPYVFTGITGGPPYRLILQIRKVTSWTGASTPNGIKFLH